MEYVYGYKDRPIQIGQCKIPLGTCRRATRFKDESAVDFVSELQLSHKTSMIIAGHQPQSVPRKVKITCCVCNLE